MNLNRGFSKVVVPLYACLWLSGLGCSDAKLYSLPMTYPTVTLQINNYCTKVLGSGATTETYNFKDIFFYNQQAYFNSTQYVTDTDGDGLPDFFEQIPANMSFWDINYLYFDTTQNGYSDLVKVNLGIPATSESSMPTCSTGYTDSDGDGLTDCEEQLVGTQVGLSDTDGDGIPDGIEFRFGMDPLDPNDAYLEPAGDGFTNYQKVKWGIPISTYVTPMVQTQFPIYAQSTPNTTTGAACASPLSFTISNISILPVATGNTLQVMTIEDPQSPIPSGSSYARLTQWLTIDVPPGIVTGSTITVDSGINSTVISAPVVTTPAGGS